MPLGVSFEVNTLFLVGCANPYVQKMCKDSLSILFFLVINIWMEVSFLIICLSSLSMCTRA